MSKTEQKSDPFGHAIYDYYLGERNHQLKIATDITEDDILAAEYFFRSYQDMPQIEQIALQHSKGKILDVGAGAGSHSLYLQNKCESVTALEISPLACLTMKHRGVENIINSDIFDFTEGKFDTILLLMNGSGIAGTLEGFRNMLTHLKKLLTENGAILIDSSDIRYLFEDENGDFWINVNSDRYYGQLKYEVSYKEKDKLIFDWLFIDEDHLKDIAKECDFEVTKMCNGPHYDYLYKLSHKS